MTNGWNNPELNIRFPAAGQYTLTANFRLPDNTPADNTDNPTHSVTKVVDVRNLNISISGPASVIQNITVTYRFSTPPTGVRFARWDRTPQNNGPMRYTPSDPILNVGFSEVGQYTITANFTLPDGSPYSVDKTVDVIYPELFGGKITGDISVLMPGDTPSMINSSSLASGGAGQIIYQWQKDTGDGWSNISGATSLTYQPPALNTSTRYRRVAVSGAQTAYSNDITITVFKAPVIAGYYYGNSPITIYNDPILISVLSGSAGGPVPPVGPPVPPGPVQINPISVSVKIPGNLYYEWKVDGEIVKQGVATSYYMDNLPDTEVQVSCRAVHNGMTSEWSNTVKIGPDYIDNRWRILSRPPGGGTVFFPDSPISGQRP